MTRTVGTRVNGTPSASAAFKARCAARVAAVAREKLRARVLRALQLLAIVGIPTVWVLVDSVRALAFLAVLGVLGLALAVRWV